MVHAVKNDPSYAPQAASAAAGDQDNSANISAELLIMEAIQDMNNSLNHKTSVDAQMASNLAQVESQYMQTMTTNVLEADVAKIKGDGSNTGADTQQFSTDQTTISTTDNLIKSVESTSTTSTSSDNSNMSNFMQFASSAVQLMGFTVQLLQHAM